MRFDELTLPISGSALHLTFHPRLTVLAGLAAPARQSVIDAIANATSGATPGAMISLVDKSGRKSAVTDGHFDRGEPFGTTSHIRNLLVVTPDDLGLPSPTDDLEHVRRQRELNSVHEQLEITDRELADAQRTVARRDQLTNEINEIEATLLAQGTPADRYALNRAKTLIQIEQLRATRDAFDAPSNQKARDVALVRSTVEVQLLADQWARSSSELDEIRARFGNRERLDVDQIVNFVDVPGTIPETLMNTANEYDRVLATCEELQSTMDKVLAAPSLETPSDTRVLVLATFDQEALWMTHRSVVLATDALKVAEEQERAIAMKDPAERVYLEKLHEQVNVATHRAERLWLPGILIATVTACLAAVLAIARLEPMGIPPLLLVTVLSLGVFVLRPRLAMRRARHAEATALELVGVTTLSEYNYRNSEDAEGERWRKADDLIANYEAAMEDWRSLVGDLSPIEAGRLEPQVHKWIDENDRSRQEMDGTAVRRRLERARTDLTRLTSQLSPLIEPFGIVVRREPLAANLARRVDLGQTAKLQVELDDATGIEEKITRQLQSHLEALGFESGSLASRINAYGRELDAALQRESLRTSTPDRDTIDDQIVALEAILRKPAPPAGAAASDAGHAAAMTELRNRSELLYRERDAIELPDVDRISRRRRALRQQALHIEQAQEPLDAEPDEYSVDSLVETLVRHRPNWPTSDHEPAPAILNDPFTSLDSGMKRRLLHALSEVALMTQIILLTDDAEVMNWAANGAKLGKLAMIAPGSSNSKRS